MKPHTLAPLALALCTAAYAQAPRTATTPPANSRAPVTATPARDTRGGGAATRPASTLPQAMRTITTPYYILHTDVSDDDALEAQLRITRMYEEYQRRTAGFAAAQVKEKFPFFLFRKEADYQAAGGPPKSAGVYQESRDGKRLMAIAGYRTNDYTWSVVQHEGFHQFVAATIKADLPIWVNEGLAEYFGEAQWTGDGFVSGLINPARMDDVRLGIRRSFKPFKDLMTLSDDEWIRDLNAANYDEAWSMVHFLANADNGRYQPSFVKFMTAVSKGVDGQQAWTDVFGKDVGGFQQQYAKWWLDQPEDPTRVGYLKVMVQTYTSFLARATILRNTFPDAPPGAPPFRWHHPRRFIHRCQWQGHPRRRRYHDVARRKIGVASRET